MRTHRTSICRLLIFVAAPLLIPAPAAVAASPAARLHPPAETIASLARQATRITVGLDKYASTRDPVWLTSREAAPVSAKKAKAPPTAAVTEQAIRAQYFARGGELSETDRKLNDARYFVLITSLTSI